MREVGDVALADVRAVAVGLAEADGLVDLPLEEGQEVRATYMST